MADLDDVAPPDEQLVADDEPELSTADMISEAYKIELRKLFRREGHKYTTFANPQIWRKYFPELPLSIDGLESSTVPEATVTNDAVDFARYTIQNRGFAVVHSEDINYSHLPNLQGLAAKMQKMKEFGWPPVFLFMYDEFWTFIAQLFDIMENFLGEDLRVEASVYGWALDANNPGTRTANGNFGLPHRDYTFSDCNEPDGTPYILTCWVPITDATLDNGCMHVLPKESDLLFDQEDHSRHMCAAYGRGVQDGVPATQLNFPHDATRPLPASAGSAIIWQGNLIHWGSRASPLESNPRCSIAMSFRVSPSKRPLSDSELNICGRPPLTKQEILGLTIGDRLSMVAKSLIMYAHWFPAFIGFDAHLLDVDLASILDLGDDASDVDEAAEANDHDILA